MESRPLFINPLSPKLSQYGLPRLNATQKLDTHLESLLRTVYCRYHSRAIIDILVLFTALDQEMTEYEDTS